MTTYTVQTARVAGHAQGDAVTADDLPDANVLALIAAGHLAEAKPTTSRKAKPESEAN